MKLIIITGRSGSGKSIALHVLEDLGFYCIDNLPIGLLPTLSKHIQERGINAAISIDARNLSTDPQHFHLLNDQLKAIAEDYQILFFDADENTLLKRYSETRRKHPLSTHCVSLAEALQHESLLLEPLANLAHLRIDTSHLTSHQLRDLIRKRINPDQASKLSLLFTSFGYKFGVPSDADFVFDVRCLANPNWQTELRSFTGLDKPVANFLLNQTNTQQMLYDLKSFLTTWIPHFIADNRSYMTIAIGCTGGQHRSVFIAEQLFQNFCSVYCNVQCRHRELR